MLDEKSQKIIDAAYELFLRYGFKKVTMGDIATSVGISRPTLYQAFSSKEEIFKCLISLFRDEALQKIEVAVADSFSLEEKLNAAFAIWAIEPYKVLTASPEAAELIDCGFSFAKESMDESYSAFEAVIHRLLNESKPATRNARLAHLMCTTARGIKPYVNSSEELEQMLGDLVQLVMSDC